ncbi:MAG: agmatinase [Gammaproteobacteria bacterium]|nr:agmatinase [Gammaproteobacteria bacterium]
MPRFGGPMTFMRIAEAQIGEAVDAGIVGIPLDIATSNRPGARLAPREIRDESRLLRPYNMATGAKPFDSMQVADVGDLPINTYNIEKSYEIISSNYQQILVSGCVPFALGGDHSIVLPILRTMRSVYGPVAVIHIDAHADANEHMFGEIYTHGTPFRRAVEEELLECNKVFQIGLRGTGYHPDDFDWCRNQGFRVIEAHECWNQSLVPLLTEIRGVIGDHPTYVSFDIDGLDPSVAPGTGTPEIGGLSVVQALEVIRGCRGLNIVGCDLVEVCPPFDLSKATSLLAANLVYEMLCIHPKVQYHDK